MNSSQPAIVTDCIVIGGGVIGLSIAWELRTRGKQVAIIDRQFDATRTAKQASWAGAGIIPPPPRANLNHPAERLHQLSYDLHFDWSKRLESETGIQNCFSRCGGIYIARSGGESASLVGNLEMFQHQQISADLISSQKVLDLEPALATLTQSGELKSALYLPDEAQIRNPRQLKALQTVCADKEVQFVKLDHDIIAEQMNWTIEGDSIKSLEIDGTEFVADHFCVAAGAWTYKILKTLGVTINVFPMLGQMLLFYAPELSINHIINEGPRYIVGRGDGYFLAGSTEEEVGYEGGTTEEARQDLLRFVAAILPELNEAKLKDHWSGLRPATLDSVPFIGNLPDVTNLFYATGHYRSGLTLSPGTARVLSQLITGEETEIDIRGLGLQRGL